jgi:glucokinase
MRLNLIPQQTNRPPGNILGINLDGERLLIVYGSISGQVHERVLMTPPWDQSFDTTLELIATQADRLLTLTQAQHLPLPEQLSISVSGDYDNETGLLLKAVDFPEWQNIAFKSQLGFKFNLPVFAEQKANAGAIAERIFGQAANFRNFLFVSLSPTVRVGAFLDGKIYRSNGGTSGNFGRIRIAANGPGGFGYPGSLDGFASAAGLRELAQLRHPAHWEPGFDTLQVIQDAQQGDPYALEVIVESARTLGNALAQAVLLLRPEMIVIGHPLCLLGTVYKEPFAQALSEASTLTGSQMPELHLSQLGNRLPELQALAPAIYAAREQNASKNPL